MALGQHPKDKANKIADSFFFDLYLELCLEYEAAIFMELKDSTAESYYWRMLFEWKADVSQREIGIGFAIYIYSEVWKLFQSPLN